MFRARAFATASAALLSLATGCLPAEVLQTVRHDLGDGLVFVQGGGGNSLVLVRGGRALVFDPKLRPFSDDVLDVVRQLGATPAFVVNSHEHLDHTQGNRDYTDVRLFAAPTTLRALEKDHVGGTWPRLASRLPVSVNGDLRLSVDGEPVVLVHPTPAHTDGDVFLWLPRLRVLVTGDVFDHGYYPHIDADHGGRFDGYLAAQERLCGYDAAVVIPGHGPQATRADVCASRDFLRGLRDDIASRVRRGEDDATIVEALTPPAGERYVDLGPFSNRRGVVTGLLSAQRGSR